MFQLNIAVMIKKDFVFSFRIVPCDEGIYVKMVHGATLFQCCFTDFRSVDFMDFILDCFDFDTGFDTRLLVTVPRSGDLRCQLCRHVNGNFIYSDFQSFVKLTNSYYNLEKCELRKVGCLDQFANCDMIKFFAFVVNSKQYNQLYKYLREFTC